MNFTLFSTFFQPASNATAAGGTSQTSHVPLSNVPPSAPPATTSTGSTPNPPVNQPANSAAPHTHAQPTGAQQLLNNPQASSGTQTNPNASQNSAQTGGSQQLPLPTVPNNATGNSASSTQASTAKTLHTRLHKLRSCTKFTSTWQNIGLLAGLALSIVFGFYGLKALKLAQWTANKDYLEFCGDYNVSIL
jgi:hypothetical protein